MSDEELLANYEKRLGSKGKTRTFYINQAKHFLEFADGSIERETVLNFMEHLRNKHHYGDGSRNFAFRVIRTLFNRNKIDWPFAQGEAPQIREDSMNVPALNPKTIIRMINAVKGNSEPAEKAFLALSATFALRRVEMLELNQHDIRIRDRTIHIATAKHGRERTHMIPEQIVPALQGYDFDTSISEFGLFVLWYRLESRINLEHINRVGFHSIRRTVITHLEQKLSPMTVKSFVRHKQRTSSDMTYRYSAVTYVGEEEDSVSVAGEALATDQQVFAPGVHPFIDYWRENNG